MTIVEFCMKNKVSPIYFGSWVFCLKLKHSFDEWQELDEAVLTEYLKKYMEEFYITKVI